MAWSGVLTSGGLYEVVDRTDRYKKEIATVALGRNQGSDSYYSPAHPEEVWFMMRDTGTTYMGSACDAELRDRWWDGEGDDRVERVAFAPSGGWYVWKKEGGASWEGLPDSLFDTLDKRWDAEGGVKHLSVGHNGEWFVLYKSGVYQWRGVHPTLSQLLSQKPADRRTGNIEWVELGPDGTFVALFGSHTVWCGTPDLTDHLLSCL